MNMNSNAYEIFDVANWFLQMGDMDHKKLQKLCYYAQAWNLALYDAPLMSEVFEGWAHGPVNRKLWNRLKEYGYLLVSRNEFHQSAKEICSEKQEFLKRVWATYGEFTGFQLENLTHTEDPWKKSRKGLQEHQPGSTPIKNDDMRNYYRSLLAGEGIGE